MNQKDFYWMVSFVNSNVSYTLLVNIIERKKNNHIIFKPYITISKTDVETLKKFCDIIGLSQSSIHNKTQRDSEKHNKLSVVALQNFNDINRFLLHIHPDEIIDKTRKNSYDKFIESYLIIQQIGHIHTEWNDKFEELLDIKEEMNKHRKKAKTTLSKKQWMKRIKEAVG